MDNPVDCVPSKVKKNKDSKIFKSKMELIYRNSPIRNEDR